MIIRGNKEPTGNEKKMIAALEELRGNSNAAADRPLTLLEKLALMAEAVQEAPLPAEQPKAGYMWKRYYDATGIIMWQEVPDPDYVEPEGTYLNPIPYSDGMRVKKGLFYTDGADIWECKKSGKPSGFDDTAFFDIIE